MKLKGVNKRYSKAIIPFSPIKVFFPIYLYYFIIILVKANYFEVVKQYKVRKKVCTSSC